MDKKPVKTADSSCAITSTPLSAFRISRPAKQVGGALAVRLKNRRVICRLLSDCSFQYRFKRYMPGYGINTHEIVLSEEAIGAMMSLMVKLKQANATGEAALPAKRVVRSDYGVWMMRDRDMISFSREIAERILRKTGGDPNDWRARDRIISSICDFVDETLDEVSQNPSHQGTTHLVRRTLDGVVGGTN